MKICRTPVLCFRKSRLSENSDRGAVAVEYVLCMAVAAFLMMGVERLFRGLAIDIMNLFKQIVTQFPNI